MFRFTKENTDKGITGESGMVVLGAIAINTSNFFVKLVAWAYTGSHSMFSEVSVYARNQTFNIHEIKPTSGHPQSGRYDQPGDPGLRYPQVHLHPDQEPSLRILQRAVSIMQCHAMSCKVLLYYVRYVSALISGVGIFCLGAGLSVYHGVTGLLAADHSLESVWLAMGILGGC